MTRTRGAMFGFVLLAATGCIRVPVAVKAHFCAQPAPKNHFGSGADARSCCPGPPRFVRFGAYSGACSR